MIRRAKRFLTGMLAALLLIPAALPASTAANAVNMYMTYEPQGKVKPGETVTVTLHLENSLDLCGKIYGIVGRFTYDDTRFTVVPKSMKTAFSGDLTSNYGEGSIKPNQLQYFFFDDADPVKSPDKIASNGGIFLSFQLLVKEDANGGKTTIRYQHIPEQLVTQSGEKNIPVTTSDLEMEIDAPYDPGRDPSEEPEASSSQPVSSGASSYGAASQPGAVSSEASAAPEKNKTPVFSDKVIENDKVDNVQVETGETVKPDTLKDILGKKKGLTFEYKVNGLLFSAVTFWGEDLLTAPEAEADFTLKAGSVYDSKISENFSREYYAYSFQQPPVMQFKRAVMKLYVGDDYQDGQALYVYRFNTDKNGLEYLKEEAVVSEGFISFEINDFSDLIVSAQSAKKADVIETEFSKGSVSDSMHVLYWILMSVCILLVAAGIVIYIFVIKKKSEAKQEEKK